jgi:hypothetical protein
LKQFLEEYLLVKQAKLVLQRLIKFGWINFHKFVKNFKHICEKTLQI